MSFWETVCPWPHSKIAAWPVADGWVAGFLNFLDGNLVVEEAEKCNGGIAILNEIGYGQ